MSIPARIIRSVPATTTQQVEDWWSQAQAIMPDFEFVTFRDPIDPELFPLTSPYWKKCSSGAMLAGLVRLEALWHGGGIWLDSDVEVYRSLRPLLQVQAFAAYEDPGVVPDAILGATPGHPAIGACIELATQRIKAHSGHWQTDGPWGCGPGVTTTILPGRDDVLLFPPASFYPVHYTEWQGCASHVPAPFTFAIHHWMNSWQGGRK